MRVIAPADCRRVPWKNGLGTTLELASDAAQWTWRLAIADMPARAPFSAYPGVDRFIACLSGPGLVLERAGARVPVPREGEALPFAGEDGVTGAPLGPDVRDINLMLRRDRWRGRMTLSRGRPLALEGAVVVVHAAEGSLRASTDEGVVELQPGHTLIASGRVAIAAARGAVAAACELSGA